MYQIYCDDTLIHDARIDYLKVFNAKCNLEVNKTGSLNFEILPTHPYYSVFKKHKSRVTLCQNGKVLFCGRVLNDDITFEKIKKVECEGELSYLLDSIFRPFEYVSVGIKGYLDDLIANHNSQVDEYKQFKLGYVTVTGDRLSNVKFNYDDTLSLVNNLIKKYGGYISLRYEDDGKYIDYLKDNVGTCNQVIQFGKNIINMNTNIKGENIYTALIATGKDISLSDVENGTYQGFVKVDDYLYSPEAVEKYGWIWQQVKYNNVETTNTLLQSAINDLKNNINTQLTIELTALDLHLLDVNVDRIDVGNFIRCVSEPHNIDLTMLVKSISINVDDPTKTTVKLVLPEQFQQVVEDKITDNINNNSPKNTEQYQKEIDDLNTSVGNLNTSVNDLNQGIVDTRNWVSDNFYPKSGSTIDLSDYAKISDVNTAFSQLASVIEGV